MSSAAGIAEGKVQKKKETVIDRVNDGLVKLRALATNRLIARRRILHAIQDLNESNAMNMIPIQRGRVSALRGSGLRLNLLIGFSQYSFVILQLLCI